MTKSSNYLNRLSLLTGTGFFILENNILEECGKSSGSNPIAICKNFQEKLLHMADVKSVPVLYQDGYQILWGCVKQKDQYILIGPMSIKNLSRLELHHYYREYGIHAGEEKRCRSLRCHRLWQLCRWLPWNLLSLPVHRKQ